MVEELSSEQFSLSIARVDFLNYYYNNLTSLVQFFYYLADENSKTTFLKLLKYNMATALCGFQNAIKKYCLFDLQQWGAYTRRAAHIQKIPPSALDHYYSLDKIETFILEGYNYNNLVYASEGDYVLDCGAYTGNTAVYFHEKIGSTGKVYSFEPHPATFKVLQNNLKNYNINLYNCALSKDNKSVKFSQTPMPGAQIKDDAVGTIEVPCITIDQFVAENHIPKIDFIKMDIEGAEVDALIGASNTIKTFKPKLAICIYHKVEDFKTILEKIIEINNNYVFFIKHNSYSFLETVLFAIDKNKLDQSKYVTLLPSQESILDETNSVKTSWNIFNNIYMNKEKLLRKNHLDQYRLILKTKYKLDCNFIYDTVHYNSLKIMINQKHNLYYAIAYVNTEDLISISVAFYFPPQFKNIEHILNLIRDKLHTSDIIYKFNVRESYALGFKIDDITNYDYVCFLFAYLIKNSLDVLLEHNLVSNDFSYQLHNSGFTNTL